MEKLRETSKSIDVQGRDVYLLVTPEFVSKDDLERMREAARNNLGEGLILFKAEGSFQFDCETFRFEGLSNIIGVYGEASKVLDFIQYGRANGRTQVIGVRAGLTTTWGYLVGRLPKPLSMILGEPTRLLKFGFVGATGTLVNLFVSSLIFYLKLAGAFLSTIVGFEASTLWNFILHEHWTFRDLASLKPGLVLNRLLKFHLSALASLFSQLGLVYLGNIVLGYNYAASLLAGIIVGFLINYVISRYYAWK